MLLGTIFEGIESYSFILIKIMNTPSPDEYKILCQYRDTIDKACMVVHIDREGRTTYVNDLYCTISGYSREEVIGYPHMNQLDIPPDVRDDLLTTIRS